MYVEFPKVPYEIGEHVLAYVHGRDKEGFEVEGTVLSGRYEHCSVDTFTIQLLIEFQNRERLWVNMSKLESLDNELQGIE